MAEVTAWKGDRPAYFPEAGGFVPTPVYDRYALAPGETLVGPAIVEERESTTVVPPGDRLEVDPQGNLRIRVARTTSLEPAASAGRCCRTPSPSPTRSSPPAWRRASSPSSGWVLYASAKLRAPY